MKRVISFAGYSFPDTQDQFSDTFTNVVPRTVRLPDLPGAYDELGMEAAPSETGAIKFKFLLLAQTRAEITQKRDAVRALAGVGVRKLIVQPADEDLLPRYTYARIQNIGMPENAKRLDTWQEVSLDFQVAYPRWMQDAVGSAVQPEWGGTTWGNFTWSGGWGVLPVGTESPGALGRWGYDTWGSLVWGTFVETTHTVTNDGNAIAIPQLIFTCTEAATSGLTVERLVNGRVKDRIRFSGAIALGQILKIDCRALSVRLGGYSAYSSFEYDHPAWLRLAPGANTLRVTLPSGGGNLKIVYPHTWF